MKTQFELLGYGLACVLLVLMFLASSSCVQSVTVRGKYADYTVTPHKPIEVEPAK
jgi:hypothetical protein